MTRRIAHIDMDAFFASVELLNAPELQGQAVAVGGSRHQRSEQQPDGSHRHRYTRLRDYVGRGVLTTATYEARALGIHSGMGIMRAARLAPDVILLPAHFDEYRKYSRLFKTAVASIAPLIEDRGIDEIYIDLTHLPGETREIAARIKQAVRHSTGLSCSIGITPNKLLSKIASDLEKPDGMTILGMADLPHRIWPLPVRKINGIGPKASAKLTALGLHTIGKLAAADPIFLIGQFGAHYGTWLHHAANGMDDRPLIARGTPKSISREITFERDLHPRHDRAALSEIFTTLCQRVAADLNRKGCVGRTIGIKLRYDDFHTVTRDVTLPASTSSAATIRHAAGTCLKRVPLERSLRLLGVRVTTLQPRNNDDPALQHEPQQGELNLSLNPGLI